LNLRKSFIFPPRFEFVGIDVCNDGNRPAKSKHDLLQTWPQPELVQDVAKFIGFAQFYSRFIHHFELRIAPLRELTTKLEFTESAAPHWTNDAQAALDDVRNAILSDPCLQRFDHQKPLCCAPISRRTASATCFVSQLRMNLCSEQCRSIGMAAASRSWLRAHRRSSILFALAHDDPAETRYGYTPTWVRGLPATINQQMQPYALRPEIRLGNGLLRHKIHFVLRRRQCGDTTPADAPYVLGR
jgi:hypothetical protein